MSSEKPHGGSRGRRGSARGASPAAAAEPSWDPTHDPGTGTARGRADVVGPARQPTHLITHGAHIRLGTAGWTDRTLIASGVFYPEDANTPETRLRYYASVFPLVEVDATYYALPTSEMAGLWVARTPDDFVFDVKAHALMTGHPTEVSRLPRALRDALPADLREAKRVYPKDLPPEVLDEVWSLFLGALRPLRAAGKLGAVLMQYPPWFGPTRESAAELERARERLGEVHGAVEFRQAGWLGERLWGRTEALLRRLGMSYVAVDEPQGTRSSVPPMPLVTSPELAVVRLHGRRRDTWDRRGAPVSERYRYLYEPDELREWIPRIGQVAEAARQVHVVFNNCYGNYGTTNALEMGAMLAADLGERGVNGNP